MKDKENKSENMQKFSVEIEEILEVAKIVNNSCSGVACKECDAMDDLTEGQLKGLWCNDIKTAQNIYNAGYRKLPKDSVVLSREEYDDLVESKRQLGYYIEDQAILLQGNIPQGCVVLSKEEYQKKLDERYSTGYYFGKQDALTADKEESDNQDCETTVNEQASKETAEKFANFVKSKLFELGNIVNERDVDDMLKEYLCTM